MAKLILIQRDFHQIPFVRSLSSQYKHLWFYILNSSHPSGFWYPDLAIAEVYLGEKYDIEDVRKVFADKYFEVGDKWFIQDYLITNAQKGLIHTNNPHKGVFKDMVLNGLPYEEYPHLFKSSFEEFEREYYGDDWVKGESSMSQNRVKPEYKDKNKANNKEKDIDIDIDVSASEDTAREFDTPEEFVKWFNTNYPKPINNGEEKELAVQAKKVTENTALAIRIRTNIQGVKRLGPGMVSPPIAWIKNEIEQFGNISR